MTTYTSSPRCTRHCEHRATGIFHTFECFLLNLATTWNRSANNQGKALNAR